MLVTAIGFIPALHISMYFPSKTGFSHILLVYLPGGMEAGDMPTNAEDTDSIPGPGRFHMSQSIWA